MPTPRALHAQALQAQLAPPPAALGTPPPPLPALGTIGQRGGDAQLTGGLSNNDTSGRPKDWDALLQGGQTLPRLGSVSILLVRLTICNETATVDSYNPWARTQEAEVS